MVNELSSPGFELRGITINQALYDVIKDYGDKNNLTMDESLEKLVGVGYTCEKYGGVFKVNTPTENEAKRKAEEEKVNESQDTGKNDGSTDEGQFNGKPGIKITYLK